MTRKIGFFIFFLIFVFLNFWLLKNEVSAQCYIDNTSLCEPLVNECGISEDCGSYKPASCGCDPGWTESCELVPGNAVVTCGPVLCMDTSPAGQPDCFAGAACVFQNNYNCLIPQADICHCDPPPYAEGSYTPSCDSGIVCTGSCTAPPDTCNLFNGTQDQCTYTSYSGGGPCTPAAAPDQPCTVDNCQPGYFCNGGICNPVYSEGYYQGYYESYYQTYYQAYYQSTYEGAYYVQAYYQGYYEGYYQGYYQGYYEGAYGSPPGPFTMNGPSTDCTGTTPSISLSWNASAGAASYTVLRDTAPYAAVGAVTTYTDNVVTSGNTYTYQIRATNGDGDTLSTNSIAVGATWCVGDALVRVSLDASPWAGDLNYDLLGPGSFSGTTAPTTHPNLAGGVWTVFLSAGFEGPAEATLVNITRGDSSVCGVLSCAQTIPANVSTKPNPIYQVNFVSNDFSLSNGGNKSAAQGGSVGQTITATHIAGTLADASFSVSGLPVGASALFVPTSCAPTCTTDMTLTAGGASPPGTYTITVTATSASLVRTTQFSFTVTATAPNPPSNLVIVNPCGTQVDLSWTDNSTNETEFRIYRNKPAQQGSNNLNDYNQIGTNAANDNTYTDNPATGNTYSYAVTAANGPIESAATFSLVISNDPCVPVIGGPFTRIRVNGAPYVGQVVRAGDTVTVRLSISNTGTAPATNLYVEYDNLQNMAYKTGTAVCSGCTNSPLPSSGSDPVRFNASQNLGTKLVDANNWNVDFDVLVTSNTVQPVDFYQGRAIIYYDGGSVAVMGGPWIMRSGAARVPQIEEIAP